MSSRLVRSSGLHRGLWARFGVFRHRFVSPREMSASAFGPAVRRQASHFQLASRESPATSRFFSAAMVSRVAPPIATSTRRPAWTSPFTTHPSPARSRLTSPWTEAGAAVRGEAAQFGPTAAHVGGVHGDQSQAQGAASGRRGGETMTESTAIQIWIARAFPDAGLLPDDPWQELKAISLHSWCSSGIHPYLSRINAPPRVCDVPGAGRERGTPREGIPDRGVRDRRRHAGRPGILLRPLHRARCAFLLVLPAGDAVRLRAWRFSQHRRPFRAHAGEGTASGSCSPTKSR